MWAELHGKLEAVAATVPAASVYLDNRPVKLPWSTSALKRMRKNKDRAWVEFDINPNEINFSNAISKQHTFEEEEFKAKVKYEKKITSNLKNNCKAFYAYLRNKRQVKSSVVSLDRGDGTRTDTTAEAAEVLATAFSSVFVHEPSGPLPKNLNFEENECVIDDMVLRSSDVKKQLLKLNIFKSSGPDGVHPKLLKSLAHDDKFVEAVTQLFVKCSETGTLPDIWKSASVVALFKKGTKSDPLNYRPVSLTCILCKVYEKLVREHLLDFLEERISKHQHGFVKGKSCLSNLLETFDNILNLLDEGVPVDLLYFDFSKAFDTVPHFRLLSKLEGFGIKGKVLEIIKDFLTERTMRVCVEGQWSDVKHVLSGVPQGSVLGPLLFILYVNDLPDIVKNKIKLFADDLKLICNANDYRSIADDILELEIWESIWGLKFNPSKCKVVHVNFNNNPNVKYSLNGVELEVSAQEKDLGVITHSSLLWNEQIKTSVSKANKMICWVVRNLINREKNVMLAIYKALIRPHLEYCVQLWNPVAAHGNWATVLELESVQRRFTRLIDEVGTLPYSRRLEILNLTTLAERRIRGDLIEAFKATSGLTDYGSGILYRPPSGDSTEALNELKKIIGMCPNKNVYLLGDFNINMHDKSSKLVGDFENIIFGFGLTPLISTFTHHKPGCNKTCIDNILTNSCEKVIQSGTMSTCISHHHAIFSIFKSPIITENSQSGQKHFQYYDYNNKNVNKFVNQLEFKLISEPPNNFSEFLSEFNDQLDKACKLERPKCSKRTAKNNPWITQGLITSIDSKHELYNNWKKAEKQKCLTPNLQSDNRGRCSSCSNCIAEVARHKEFTVYRRSLNHLINSAKRKYHGEKISECAGDSKKTWQIINNLRGKKTRVIKPNFIIDDERVTNRRVIANEFNKYFASLASNLNEAYSGDYLRINPMPSFTDYLPTSISSSIYLRECDGQEIIEIISELKNGKSSDIPIHVIKKSTHIIAPYLVKYFNRCMQDGFFPCELKTGRISPIYKKEDEQLLENYRPVSTLPVFGKIFEKIIYSRLYSFLISKGVINENQFGFRKGHSASNALNYSVEHIESLLAKKQHVLGIFIDLSKAFDTIDHRKLTTKLEHYGIRGNALQLISSYLSNRKQYVNVLDIKSDELPVHYGVPQGSVLGPLLFILYINDICNISTDAKLVLFADDTNIFVAAESISKVYEIANKRTRKDFTEMAIHEKYPVVSEMVKSVRTSARQFSISRWPD
ncbi:hypothetical protein ACHWQZ_G009170 [Mnemiopsis leidyi]